MNVRLTRAAVVVYSTEPLASDITLMGPVCARLYVSVSVPSADLFATLALRPRGGGALLPLAEGAVCLSQFAPSPAAPLTDRLVRASFDLGCAAARAARGDQLLLLLSALSFPRYARNMGGGDGAPAVLRVVHTAAQRSCVLLPVLLE
jgi:predicted acyl esterase